MKGKAKAKLSSSHTSSSAGASAVDRSAASKAMPTEEMAQLANVANDPSFAVEFAIGDPFPELIPQDPNDDAHIRLAGVYFTENKRYLLKKAHFSHEDRRVFDVESGQVILASHHEGKNPYEEIDPLGFNESATGEWKSKTTVTSVHGRYPSFKIRPKTLSRHGIQYVDLIGDAEDEVLTVGKMGKTRTKSMRPHFSVGRGKEKGKGSKLVYKIVGDIVGRTMSIENAKGEVIAVMAKTSKAMLKTAVFGSGSESTIDVASGVDCSTILCIIFALGQVGAHFVKDCFANFVQDPIQDAAVESAAGALTGNTVGDAGALGELAEDVGLGDELDGAGDYAEDVLDEMGVGEFAEDIGEGASDFVGEAMSFIFDLFGE